jgi:transcriptional regulator with XRE-family HTH domain
MSDPRVKLYRVGPRIRCLRHARLWSLEELAGRARLAPNTVGKIELNKVKPNYLSIKKLAAALGVPAGQLLTGGPQVPDEWPHDDPEDNAFWEEVHTGATLAELARQEAAEDME